MQRAGNAALILGALRNNCIVFALLPKLDVAGSSPVARSDYSVVANLVAGTPWS